MRKISFAIVALLTALVSVSCSDDHDDLWNEVDNLRDRVAQIEQTQSTVNNNLSALQSIVNAMQGNLTITSVTQTEQGYDVKFSDGTSATILHGRNGTDGVNAPAIAVARDADGNYYWTLDGEWLLVDGRKVRANGLDGADGASAETAVAPQVRINEATGVWEISVDGGKTWTSTGVKAAGEKGEKGDSMFEGVDTSNPDYVVFRLAGGSEIRIARHDDKTPLFTVAGADVVQEFLGGETVGYAVTTANVAECVISKPDGWRVSYDATAAKIAVTAPKAENPYAEKAGTVAITAVSAAGRSIIVKIEVKIVDFKLKVLTFEDADARFDPYTLDYCGVTVRTWSDLISPDQKFGARMLYGDSYMMDEPYWFYDKGNTELKHTFVETSGYYSYMMFGHAVSNYASTNLADGNADHQLTVYGSAPGGHNGSSNFAMHFGYLDDSGYGMASDVPSLEFGDGKERTIDHMWINNSLYGLNVMKNSNGLSDAIAPGDWVKIVATGYNSAGAKTGETEIIICDGPDKIVDTWTKWDLSTLGNVARVKFNVTGTPDNGYGLSIPAYFAYDDVAVRFTAD